MKHEHISFIDYNMDQLCLPLDLEVKIPQNHLSRIVHQAVEQIKETIDALERRLQQEPKVKREEKTEGKVA